MNNKGFAISTMLYGLLVMIFLITVVIANIMSTAHQLEDDLAEQIEGELNRIGATSVIFRYNKTSSSANLNQGYAIPRTGWYKIELFGAQGGNSGAKYGGKGAYTSGYIYLEAGRQLYFNVGGQPTNSSGGVNGGGNSGSLSNAKGGGGATDVRLNGTALSDRIMVAAGGGGANSSVSGGAGGALVGESGIVSKDTELVYKDALGGSQSQGGTSGTGSSDNGSFGKGGSSSSNYGGGGAGFYGGGAGGNYSGAIGSGAGGSSYISGYGGVSKALSSNSTQINKNLIHHSGARFLNGQMLADNHGGSGEARIYLISENSSEQPPLYRTEALSNVRYIKDCITGNSEDDDNHWTEIETIKSGINVAKGASVQTPSGVSKTSIVDGDLSTSATSERSGGEAIEECVLVDLGGTYNLDEVVSWHYFLDHRYYKNFKLSVGSSLSSLREVKSGEIEETSNGIRVSDWS